MFERISIGMLMVSAKNSHARKTLKSLSIFPRSLKHIAAMRKNADKE